VTTLDPFQFETLAFLDQAQGRAVVADPMGARKTGTILSWLAASPRSTLTLVVAPSSVHGHWFREVEKFFPRAVPFLGMGTPKKRNGALDLAADHACRHVPALYVTTYESMKQDEARLRRTLFDTVVFDEGHKLKGRRTQVALTANAVCAGVPHVIIATGTPVLNHAAELWQYLHMLKPKQYRSFWRWVEEHFKIEYAHFNGFGGRETKIIHGPLPGHEELLRHEIADHFIQRDIAELFPNEAWVEEPENIEIEVKLTGAERKVYDNLVKHQWGKLGEVEVITDNALSLTTRLNQLTSDWGTLNDQLHAGTKVHAAIDLVRNLLARDEQVVVFAKYKHTVGRIMAGLLDVAVEYTGDWPPVIRETAIKRFCSGEVQVIVGTLDSLSEGIDGLQHAASNIVMVDRHWTPAKNDQAIGRLRRSGQEKVVTVYHVFAADTIDATITAACLRKVNVIQSLKDRPLVDSLYGKRL